MQPCPLCRSPSSQVVETLDAGKIAALYRKAYGLDVRHLFAEPQLAFRRCGDCDLRFFEAARAGDQAFYAGLNRNEWYYMEEKPEFEFARQVIGDAGAVLEVGAGAGLFARKLARERYTGLEFSESAARYAERAGIRLLNESIQAHALAHPGRYDVVCHFQVLEHVEDPRGFLEACVACLRPGGTLIVAVPAWDCFLRTVTNDLLNLPPHHLTRWSDAAVSAIARLLGLELLRVKHEPVAPFLRRGYLDAWLSYALNALAGRRPKLLDTGAAQRLVARLARVSGALLEPIAPAFVFGRGHTVSAVFRRG